MFLVCFFVVFFFFFQAEDGIRDTSVTGVQTCALPISRRDATPRPVPRTRSAPRPSPGRWPAPRPPEEEGRRGRPADTPNHPTAAPHRRLPIPLFGGNVSCARPHQVPWALSSLPPRSVEPDEAALQRS